MTARGNPAQVAQDLINLGSDNTDTSDVSTRRPQVTSADGLATVAAAAEAAAAATATTIPNPFAPNSSGADMTVSSVSILGNTSDNTQSHVTAHNADHLMVQAEHASPGDDDITVDTGTESSSVGIVTGNRGSTAIGGDHSVNIQHRGVAAAAAAAGRIPLPPAQMPAGFVPHLTPIGEEGDTTLGPRSALSIPGTAEAVTTATTPTPTRRWEVITTAPTVGNTFSSSSPSIGTAAPASAAATPTLSMQAPPHDIGPTTSISNTFSMPATKLIDHQQQPRPPESSSLNGDCKNFSQAMSSPTVPGMVVGGAGEGLEVVGVRMATSSRRQRVVRADDGTLYALPTNVYKQAGGLKLDLSLGGVRINGEKCTMKNRAFNFGVLPGITRENILALRYDTHTVL